MNKLMNKKNLIFGLPALLMMVIGIRFWPALILGALLLCLYARAKGYSPLMGFLMSFLAFIGATILLFMSDRNEPNEINMDNTPKIVAKFILIKVGILVGIIILILFLAIVYKNSGKSIEAQTNSIGFWFMLITVVTASVILYLRGQSGQELRLIKAAEKALKSSDFEEACYTYASALLRTPSQYYSKKHIAKINELWRNHGPFTFDRKKRDLEAAIENLRQEGDTKECCGESGLAMEWVFHEIILEKIQEIVENRVTGISWPRKVKIIQLWEVTSGPLGTIVKLAPQNKV